MSDKEIMIGQRHSQHRKGMPLALLIGRYFLYVLVTTGALLFVFLCAFNILVSSGTIYIASYAEDYVSEMAQSLESGEAGVADIPSCYHWVETDADGALVDSDMSEEDATAALAQGEDGYPGWGSMTKMTKVALPNGGECILFYDFVPDFTSRDLRDSLPDPQTLLLGAFTILFVASIAAIAVRASHVISRKMRPLAEAAANIERQNLDFAVGSTNVREINDALVAIERMRSSLDESLKARWATDEAQRNQVAALAHDLKTPLAIARWNADLLRETELDPNQSACSRDLSESIARLGDYVHLLTEVSQQGLEPMTRDEVDVFALAEQVKQQAQQFCRANGLVLRHSCTYFGTVQGNALELERAVMNLVANAVDHAPAGSTVTIGFADQEGTLTVSVEDQGPGFSRESLERGKDRFYTGSEDRNIEKGHYGLGLATAEDIAKAHGGTLTLENTKPTGARCLLRIPSAESEYLTR